MEIHTELWATSGLVRLGCSLAELVATVPMESISEPKHGGELQNGTVIACIPDWGLRSSKRLVDPVACAEFNR